MYHLSEAKDSQSQDFADIYGENQRPKDSGNCVPMEIGIIGYSDIEKLEKSTGEN